jgi:hypothetical protein
MLRPVFLTSTAPNRWNGGRESPREGNDCQGRQVYVEHLSTPFHYDFHTHKPGNIDAWGGGSCKGPTHDQPPYEYGDIGFDCSGLVCWALCQVTGRDLFKEGLRVTRSMYCASESTLKYQKHPYSQRQPGDAIFFGGSCDCVNNPSSIHHVGLSIDGGDRMWNSPNDRVNQVQENSIKGFGDTPCPYVIRFT